MRGALDAGRLEARGAFVRGVCHDVSGGMGGRCGRALAFGCRFFGRELAFGCRFFGRHFAFRPVLRPNSLVGFRTSDFAGGS
jgi:hypothetical protein